jgi:hypothetical protein
MAPTSKSCTELPGDSCVRIVRLLNPELPEVVIGVAVHQDAPLLAREMSEGGVLGPLVPGSLRETNG